MKDDAPWWVKAIQLKDDGPDLVVLIEIITGRWVEVIRERRDGPISHIVEQDGIKRAVYESAKVR